MRIDAIDPTGLVPAEPDQALQLFSADPEAAFGTFVTRVQLEASVFVQTATAATQDGRDAIKAMASRIAKSRTHIELVGKRIAAEQKEIPKKIDASRRYVRTALEQLEAHVRAPLTDWEEEQAAAVEDYRASIAFLRDSLAVGHLSADQLKDRLDAVRDLDRVPPPGEDFDGAAFKSAKEAALSVLPIAIAAAQTRAAEAVELQRLRAESECRKRLDQEADITSHAEQRARQIATDAADQEANAAALRVANKEHRATVNRSALAAFVAGGLPDDMARRAVELIACGKVPAVRMSY